MSILVTGGTGFIGSHLVEKLLLQKRPVRVLAMDKPMEDIENENLDIIKSKGAEIVYGDLRDKKSLQEALKDIDVVFHLGAISRPMKIPKQLYYDVNAEGTKNLLEAALFVKVTKFVHVSTVSVLGVSPDGHPLREDEFQVLEDDYGLSKKKGEEAAIFFYKQYKLPVVVVRPPLVYGPRCLVRSIMFKYTQRRIFPLFNQGESRMEFCYVDNIVQGIMLAESKPNIEGEVFNLSDGQSYKIGDIIRGIARAEDVSPPLFQNLPVWLGQLLGVFAEIFSKIVGIHPPFSRITANWMSSDQNVYDISRAKKNIGYSPSVSLEEGLKRTVDWYRNRGVL